LELGFTGIACDISQFTANMKKNQIIGLKGKFKDFLAPSDSPSIGGEGKNWGTPPNPWQEESCTSFQLSKSQS
jgi:hypothetical protein